MTALGRSRREAARWLALLAVLVLVFVQGMHAHAHGPARGLVDRTVGHSHADATAPADHEDGTADHGTAAPDLCLGCFLSAIPPAAAVLTRGSPSRFRLVVRERPRLAGIAPASPREPPRPFA